MKKMKVGGKSHSLDDARARFKHLSLLQDFQELLKGTEVASNRLKIVKDKKLTLEAEVRFLRKRYAFLLQVRAQSHRKKLDTMVPQKVNSLSEKTVMATNVAMNGAAARPPRPPRPPVPKFKSSQKEKVHIKRDPTPTMRSLSQSNDFNQNITKLNVPQSTPRNRIHQLDLNQIANDDDYQPSTDLINIEASALVKGLTDEPLTDMKLSACRNIGNAASTSHTGKRKISWQDQVALRV